MESTPRVLDLQRVGTRVEGNLIWHRSVGSTNDVARKAAQAGEPDGTVVLAEEQVAGRGRRRRSWYSPRGTGLYVSLVVRSGAWFDRPAVAQLGAGVAVAEAVAGCTRAEVELVWPNDCYAAGAKIGGVLVEAETTGGQFEFLVCGMGVNVNQSREEFPDELRAHATSIARLTGAACDRTDLLLVLLDRLGELRRMADAEGPAAVLARWAAISPSSMDTEVQVDTIEGILSGRTAGLSPEGALRLRVDGEDVVREITVGELVKVRRRR